MYSTKEIDHEKRKTQTGSYSPYNYIYRYLMDNFEPNQVSAADTTLRKTLYNEYVAYCVKGGKQVNQAEINKDVDDAIQNFITNDSKHGNTADNLGKAYDNSFHTIASTISDLRVF